MSLESKAEAKSEELISHNRVANLALAILHAREICGVPATFRTRKIWLVLSEVNQIITEGAHHRFLVMIPEHEDCSDGTQNQNVDHVGREVKQALLLTVAIHHVGECGTAENLE